MIGRLLAGAALLVVTAGSVVFLFTGATKLCDLPAFEETLSAHGLIASRLVPFAAPAIGAAEVFIGGWSLATLLASHYRERAALIVGFGFAAIAWYCWMLVLDPPARPTGCGCGLGRRPVVDWTPLALRNTAALGLALGAWFPIRESAAAMPCSASPAARSPR